MEIIGVWNGRGVECVCVGGGRMARCHNYGNARGDTHRPSLFVHGYVYYRVCVCVCVCV